jgi:hypothetical protein
MRWCCWLLAACNKDTADGRFPNYHFDAHAAAVRYSL